MMNDVRGYSVIGGDGLSMLASGTKPDHQQAFYYGNSPALAYMGNPYYRKAAYPEVSLVYLQQAIHVMLLLILSTSHTISGCAGFDSRSSSFIPPLPLLGLQS